MSDMMTFPDTWEEFENSYGFTDNEEVYTNGARLIPSFRVKQWLDHLPSTEPERKKGKWIDYSDEGYVECQFCHSATNCDDNKDELHYCFSCGAELRRDEAKEGGDKGC